MNTYKDVYTEIQKARILVLYNQGYTADQISAHYGNTSHSVRRVLYDYRESGVYVRNKRIHLTEKLPRLPLAPVKEDTFNPRNAIYANVVENIKTPIIEIEGKKYRDITQIISNMNEIEAMGMNLCRRKRNGKEKTL